MPVKYLGLPLGANTERLKTWQPIVDRFKKKLVLWKRRYLAMGGRITLTKSTLANVQVYFMSVFKIPISVANQLERIQRQG